MSPLSRFLLAVLATWRVTHLLVREDGPGDLFARFRGLLGVSIFGRMMDCFYCLSLWVAMPFAFFVGGRPREWPVAWLALSGAACLLERTAREPVAVEPLSEPMEGGSLHGLLWPETRTTLEGFCDDGKDDQVPSRD